MSNTPWHHEVVEHCQTLKVELDRLREKGGPDAPPEYDLVCEHKHSVSVLLAQVDQFAVNGPDGRSLENMDRLSQIPRTIGNTRPKFFIHFLCRRLHRRNTCLGFIWIQRGML
jgi:hypothetical protein